MVYQNKFVLCVLVNGNIVKEQSDGSVCIPFGSEYTVRLRNKNNRRVLVVLYIDGENVSEGGFIVNANDYVDIKRPVNVDRAFKFVSLQSADAQDFGKNGPSTSVTGKIEARFYFEKEPYVKKYTTVPLPYTYEKPWVSQPILKWSSSTKSSLTSELQNSQITNDADTCGLYSGEIKLCDTTSIPPQNDCCLQSFGFSGQLHSSSVQGFSDGCTVEGSETGQNFATTVFCAESTCTTLVVTLRSDQNAYPEELKLKIRELDRMKEAIELEKQKHLAQQQKEVNQKIAFEKFLRENNLTLEQVKELMS